MKPLRIAGLLIAFMAYGLQTSQAQDTYTYAIDGGALSGNIQEGRPTGPRGERISADENSVLSRRVIGGAYDAANYLDWEEGDNYSFRNRDSSQYVGAQDGLSQRNYVVSDRPRSESEDDSGSRRENEGWEATGGPRFLSGLLGNAGQRGQEAASRLPSTSGRRHSGSGFGEGDYVVLRGEEPRRRESVDSASDGAYLGQFSGEGNRHRAFDAVSAAGAEEGQRGLPMIILRPPIRKAGQTDKIEGFHQVPKLHGRQSYLAADYLGELNGGLSNGGAQDDGSIEIISDGSHQGSLLGLLEGSDNQEQINPRSRSLESIRGASGDGTGPGGSLAEILSWLLRGQQRLHHPIPYRCQILYPNERFPFVISQEPGLRGGNGRNPFWRRRPQLFGVEGLPADVGNRRDGSIGGKYDGGFILPVILFDKSGDAFDKFGRRSRGTTEGGFSARGNGYDSRSVWDGNMVTEWNQLQQNRGYN